MPKFEKQNQTPEEMIQFAAMFTGWICARINQMANTLMSLLVAIGVDTADLQKGLASAEKSVGGFSQKMTSLGKTMMQTGGAMTVGLTLPIVAFGASSVKSAMEAEDAIKDLETVLKSTGSAAGMTLEELTGMASALQDVTGFSEEAVMASQGMLLTFTKIGKDIFPMATEATLDMAEKFGMDATQAAITLGKALNDPIAGVTALRRIGVMLTDEQKTMIESFMAVGDIASAQKIILGELSVELGGVAKAAGETASGQMAIFTNKLDDMKEIIGNALIPALINLMNAVTPMIIGFGNMSPAMQNTIIVIVGLVAAAGPLVTAIGGVASAVGVLAPALSALFTFITVTAIPAIAAFVIANAAWIVPLLLVAATVYLVYLAFKNNFGGITTTVQQLWAIIQWAFDQIVAKFNGVGETVKQLGAIVGWVVQNIIQAIGMVIQKVAEMAASFLNVQLPDWMTPGSPTPLELGLIGIGKAMAAISKQELPQMNIGLGKIAPVMGAGGGDGGKTQNTTINITNPRGETAESSINRQLKNLSYLGISL
jgi:hypothetical protein